MYNFEYHKINICPKQLVIYLEKHGWNKKREAEDISVWTYKRQDKTFGMFVPLSDNFVDYRERILEVLDTLEEVEQRFKFEIIQDIEKTYLQVDESVKC